MKILLDATMQCYTYKTFYGNIIILENFPVG